MRTHESGTPNPGRGTFRGCSRGQFSSLDAMFGMAGMALVLVLSFALFSTLFGSVASSLDSKGMDAHSLAAMDELNFLIALNGDRNAWCGDGQCNDEQHGEEQNPEQDESVF